MIEIVRTFSVSAAIMIRSSADHLSYQRPQFLPAQTGGARLRSRCDPARSLGRG